MIKEHTMTILRDLDQKKNVRFTKILVDQKNFIRYCYSHSGRVVDLLWLDSSREFISAGLEEKLENKFQDLNIK